MPFSMDLWNVTAGGLVEIHRSKLNYEGRLKIG